MAELSEHWPVREPALERELARGTATLWERALDGRRRLPPAVYVLTYHSVADEHDHEPWEAAYSKVRTSLSSFRAQLETLTVRMRPLPLADAAARLAKGEVDEPLLVVTFDDCYANVARGAAEVCERLGILPTLFANAEFCSGRSVYYRVLLAVLQADGHDELVARAFQTHLDDAAYATSDPFDRSKETYSPGRTEAAALEAWQRAYGGAPLPRAHLTYAELRTLTARRWTVGNHTRTHATLASLTPDEVEHEVAGNDAELRDAGLEPLPWLAFPNGAARHVGAHVGRWLDAHPEYAGLHSSGGVNFISGGSEWFRIPVGNETPGQLLRTIWRSIRATRSVLSGD